MIIKYISELTGLNSSYVSKVAKSANYRYKIYQIPKRHNKGFRIIAHPSSELKLIQRLLAENIFSQFPIHKSVFSYRKNIGIQNIAKVHLKNNYLLRLDFENFFPSIKRSDIFRFLSENKLENPFVLNKTDVEIICNIVCKDNCLAIGSPTSPIISNVILYNLDKLWHVNAKKMNIIYTRYADDIYLSTNKQNILSEFFNSAINDLKNMNYPKLFFNHNKTVFTSKKHKRLVTGLYLTTDNNVSIGRSQKRYIKSLVHRYFIGEISDDLISYLRGYLSYINAVEPLFLTSLRTKYGNETINSIFSAPLINKKLL